MTHSSAPARWLVLAAFAAVCLIWGSTYLAIRFSLETLPPFGLAAVRFLVAGGLLFGWMRFRGTPRPQWREWRSAGIVGVLLLLGGNGLVVWAEQTVPSGIAALIISSVPLFMVAIDWLLGNRPTRAVIVGLILGFAGVALLVGPTDLGLARGPRLAEAMPFDLAGVLGLLAASLSWSIGSLYARRASWPKAPLMGISMQMLLGGAALAGLALLRGETVNLASVSARSLGSLAYLIFFGAIVGFSAYVWLLSVSSTAKVSTYAFVNPAVAVVLGWWLADEALTPRTLLAAAVIIAGVVSITTARAVKPKVVETALTELIEPECTDGVCRARA